MHLSSITPISNYPHFIQCTVAEQNAQNCIFSFLGSHLKNVKQLFAEDFQLQAEGSDPSAKFACENRKDFIRSCEEIADTIRYIKKFKVNYTHDPKENQIQVDLQIKCIKNENGTWSKSDSKSATILTYQINDPEAIDDSTKPFNWITFTHATAKEEYNHSIPVTDSRKIAKYNSHPDSPWEKPLKEVTEKCIIQAMVSILREQIDSDQKYLENITLNKFSFTKRFHDPQIGESHIGIQYSFKTLKQPNVKIQEVWDMKEINGASTLKYQVSETGDLSYESSTRNYVNQKTLTEAVKMVKVEEFE